ncbi:MAG: sugar phosphate nucleotidyltransferase [Smithella sp.]|jgi:NDP-sugar pyrophosphorylase family protein
MVKRVVISAAGRGTRMKHLSKYRPKHLIEINGEPFLFHLLSNLEEAGYEDIIIVIGHMSQHIVDYVARGRHPHVRLVNQFERLGEEKYGTAIPLLAARSEIGDEDFVAVYGDNLYSVRDLKKFTIDDDFHYVAGLHQDDPSKYGVLLYDQDMFLKKIIEKPKVDVGSHIINTGLMKFTSDIFPALERVRPNPETGEYYLVDALTDLAREKKVKVTILEDYWLDFGKPEDVQILSQFLTNRKVK